MKRALAFTLMVLAIMIIAVSCEEPQVHEHTYAEEWSHDDTFHWHAAKCGHDEEVSDKSVHVWKEGGDEDGWIVDVASTETEQGKKHRECSVCGYKEEGKVPLKGHVHTFSAYDHTADKHWRICTGCGEKFTYTHTFSYASVDETYHCQKCYCGYSKNTEAHSYNDGKQKVDGTTVWNVCDKCGYLVEVDKKDTDTGVETAGNEVSIGTTTTVNGAKVNSGNVEIPVAVAAAETSDESTTTVTFPKGALKVDGNASTVSLIVKAASIATASSSDYRETLSNETDESVVVINSTEAVVAGFEFKLEGANGSDLTGSELADGSTTKKKGTTVETYIAPGLGSKDNLEIKYVGNSVNETEDNKAEINEYNTQNGYLKFTVYHFSKYAIIANTLVAKDNSGAMYFTSESETPAAVLEKALKTAVTSDETGKDVAITLLVDIDLKSNEWTPIGAGTRSGSGIGTGTGFKGTFDGGGHTISNLKISSGNASNCVGLFGILDGGTVKNLKLTNVNINASSCENVGGVVGLAVNDATIDKVEVKDGNISAPEGVGGIVGRMTISGTIANCTNGATVKATNAKGGAGGIVGKAYYSKADETEKTYEINIKNCTNNGKIESEGGYVGGIAGLLAGNASDCTNTGNVEGKGDGIGGIVGDLKMYGSITGSKNSATIADISESSNSAVGGIVGWVRYDEDTTSSYKKTDVINITGNENTSTGKITSHGTSAGGIIGLLYNAAVVTGNKNYATKIEQTASNEFASGIMGAYQNLGDQKLYKEAEGYKVTEISGNSSVELTKKEGFCVADVVWDNSEGKIKIMENTPSTNDYVCYITTSGETKYYKSLQEAVTDTTSPENPIVLLTDIEATAISEPIELGKNLTINLNEKTLNFSVTTESNDTNVNKGAFELPSSASGYSVEIKNGKIKGTRTGQKTNTFTVHGNATLTLDDVDIEITSMRGIQVCQDTAPATVKIQNGSTITVNGVYAVSTEVNTSGNEDFKNVVIKIDGSTLETIASDNNSTALLVNVPSEVTITNSTIKGQRQGAIFRGGTYTVSGSTFEYTSDDKTNKSFETADWGDENNVPNAAVVIGNRHDSYAYPTTVAFSETNALSVPEGSNQLYIYQKDQTDTRAVTVTGYNENWTINEDFNGAFVYSSDKNILYVKGAATFSQAITIEQNPDGKKIKLLGDISGYGPVAASRSFELDLNGHKISIYYGGLVIGSDNTEKIEVDITNSSEKNNGIIENTFAGGSALTIQNGTAKIKGKDYNSTDSSIKVERQNSN